ncbi:putative methionyl-tRNA synthetase [Hordeum vulgare]|nr:putative methionyl-tRNA synthetase [Hordeum vulgare]
MRDEKSKARWSALMTKQDAERDLLKTNMATKKRNTNLAFFMGGGYTTTMDLLVKACYLAERNLMPEKTATASTLNARASPTPSTATSPAFPAPAEDDEELVI